MKTRLILLSTLLFPFTGLFGQAEGDTMKIISLDAIQIQGQRSTVERLPPVHNGFLWAGKKNEVINLLYSDASIADKTPRQLFAKVPGVFVYDMDGSGNQTNISTRGLDPHRGWEFNIRKNGVIVNSDVYGYPASHYSMPMEAVEKIELVRGTGALQYGSQFGGMLNYVVKQPDTSKTIGLETINSIGSFGLLSTYNALGGKVGKLQYYAYYSKRVSDGYRENSRSDYDGQGIVLKFLASSRLSLTAELGRSNYIYQIPGPLTDSMFQENPRQATRSRNYFNPEIYVPSLSAEWKIGERSSLYWTASAVLGERRSVQFDKPANIVDAIDPLSLSYATRQVDIDQFNSYTSELRFLQGYSIGKISATLAAGAQYFHNDLHRNQIGKGTSGTDFDLSLSQTGWGRDIHFKTQNIALFAENLFQITPRLSLTPGVRVEMGESRMSGIITYLPDEEIPNSIVHHFPLFGLSGNYRIDELINVYAGFSQAYRPVIFKDIVPGSIYEIADKNLEDAKGYNMEAGIRGTAGNFRWDAGVFRLVYNNRLGNITFEEDSIFYILRTNIGNSVTHGAEMFGEYGFQISRSLRCSFFTSTALFDARYHDAVVRVGNENRDIDGNKVESVPGLISRNGITLRYKTFSVSGLYSYTGETFADPLNTEKPSANGSVGIVPAYGLVDINASWRIAPHILVRFNLNNVADISYFTKRPSFYPGPGIWPSDGRNANISVGIKW
ncbi:MAG: TonB-dependent receptor [Saprospirales bacterium]|nr:TonB-dependent receptor [Saprospirales bacterium]